MKKISVDFFGWNYTNLEYIGKVIDANDNINYVKIITDWKKIGNLDKSTVKKLEFLPLEYMNINEWTIDVTDMINIAKYNDNLKHRTFYLDANIIKIINEIPNIININTNIESYEFVYNDSDSISYLDYMIEILSTMINTDVDHIKSLKFILAHLRDNLLHYHLTFLIFSINLKVYD